jgi:hypothetical protein
MSPLSSRCGSGPAYAISFFAEGNRVNVADLAVENRCAPFSDSFDGSDEARCPAVSNPVPKPLFEPIDPPSEAKKVLGDEREGQPGVLVCLARHRGASSLDEAFGLPLCDVRDFAERLRSSLYYLTRRRILLYQP